MAMTTQIHPRNQEQKWDRLTVVLGKLKIPGHKKPDGGPKVWELGEDLRAKIKACPDIIDGADQIINKISALKLVDQLYGSAPIEKAARKAATANAAPGFYTKAQLDKVAASANKAGYRDGHREGYLKGSRVERRQQKKNHTRGKIKTACAALAVFFASVAAIYEHRRSSYLEDWATEDRRMNSALQLTNTNLRAKLKEAKNNGEGAGALVKDLSGKLDKARTEITELKERAENAEDDARRDSFIRQTVVRNADNPQALEKALKEFEKQSHPARARAKPLRFLRKALD